MKKIIVGITLDHTFRNVYGKIVELYRKHNIDLPKAEAEDNDEEFTAPVLNLPINTNDLMNHIPFESVEEMNDFIFSEFALEIFGHAKETEPGSMQMFNSWVYDLPAEFEVVLISNEIGRTKAATFFFLSKTGFEGNNIKFIDDTIDIWEICDILITSSEIKTLKPKNKKLIIIERPYTKTLSGDKKLQSLFDLFTLDMSTFIEKEKFLITITKFLKRCLKIGKK
jgi:hypothetical protein